MARALRYGNLVAIFVCRSGRPISHRLVHAPKADFQTGESSHIVRDGRIAAWPSDFVPDVHLPGPEGNRESGSLEVAVHVFDRESAADRENDYFMTVLRSHPG